MTIYAYEKRYLDSTIYDILEYGEDSDGIELSGKIYGRVFHSDMTGMDVAIVSENKSDVENISDDDFLDWLDTEDDSSLETFYGLPIISDESEDFGIMRTAVLFTEPLDSIVISNDIDDVAVAFRFAIDEVDNFYFTYPDSYVFPGCEIKVVEYSHFRF